MMNVGMTLFQTLTILASVTALVISFRVQRQLLRLQSLQEKLTALQIAERRVQVKTELIDEAIHFRPFLPDQDVNTLTVHFPAALKLAPVALAAPDLDVPIVRFELAIRRFWESQTPPSPGVAKVRLTAMVPVVLEVYGHTKGVAVVTRAFYSLYSRYVRLPDGTSEHQIRGLSLNNYLTEEQNVQFALDEAFQETLAALAAGDVAD